ncbi:helix-turn-helix domain-containing protein [Candidatus Binatia bacterium]|nr:helix-turn-helix domain-containing protein [Candidatus Binatia bacterium]
MANTPTNGNHTVGLLNETDAARRLALSVATLRRWRWAGRGPAFRKLGAAVRYAAADLDAYVAASVRTSTSDDGNAHAAD